MLAPSLIQKKFPKYKIICDIDTDCIPGFLARNIFEKLKKLKKMKFISTKPVPLSFSQKNLGKRISLLRKLYISNKFPLDSIIIASNSERSKMFGYDNIGTSPTIGTCLASTSTLAKTGRKFYRDIFYYIKNLNICKIIDLIIIRKILKSNGFPMNFKQDGIMRCVYITRSYILKNLENIFLNVLFLLFIE